MQHFLFKNAFVISVEGKDASRYLNARLSNKLEILSNKKAMPAAILTAQGKAEGFFTVLALQEKFLLYCTGGNSTEVISALKRFIVADQVTVSHLAEHSLIHLSCDDPSDVKGIVEYCPSNQYDIFQNQNSIGVRQNRIGTVGIDILVENDKRPKVLQKLIEKKSTGLSEVEYEFQRLAYGTLSFPQEINDSLLFAETELDEAISFSKGCYVGQEALEMLAARGKLPAKLVRVHVKGVKEINFEAIYEDATLKKRIGKIVSTTENPNKTGEYLSFARIKTDKADLEKIFLDEQTEGIVSSRKDPWPQM